MSRPRILKSICILLCSVLFLSSSNCFFFTRSFPPSNISSGLPWRLSSKNSTWQFRRCGLIPESQRSPGGGKWPPPPVLLSGESHGQRSLVDYSPCGCKEVGHNSNPAHGSYFENQSYAALWAEEISAEPPVHQ